MNKDLRDLYLLALLIALTTLLSGCATFKQTANWRAEQKEKCECAPAWGMGFK